VDVGRGGRVPVGNGASSKDSAACIKEIPEGEGSAKVRLGGGAPNKSNGLGMGRFAGGRETRAVSGWGSGHNWRSGWTLRRGFREARIGGVSNILVPGRTESGEDFAAEGTGASEGAVLATTVDAERGGGIAVSYDRLLKASIRTALVSTSVGRTVMEESADWASLWLLFAQRSRVSKAPALPALGGLGGRVGGGDCAGPGQKSDAFAKPGKMKWVNCINHRGCELVGPFHRVLLQQSSPKNGDINSIAD